MTDTLRDNLTAVFRENLENDLIAILAERTRMPIREAMDAYYRSKLSEQVSAGKFGIDNLDPKYLVEDLLENEPSLFPSSTPRQPEPNS